MRNGNFAGLEAVLVYHMLLGGEDEPDGFVLDSGILNIRIVIADQSLLGRTLLQFLLG